MARWPSRFVAAMGLVLVGVAGAAWPEAADSFYVSPSGDDANPGTEVKPFQTLARARGAVRAVSGVMKGDIVVHVDGGLYRLEEPLCLDARDSGQNGHTVIYRAWRQENAPVLSGGQRITGWQRDEGSRWKAEVNLADTRQLYINGVRAQRARGTFPEGAERFGDLAYIDAEAGYRVPGNQAMAGWQHPEDVEFGYFNSWSHMLCKVERIARTDKGVEVIMQQPGFFLACRKEGVRAEGMPDYVENALELLDEPGEWYLDKHAGVVYYIPRDGEDMESANVVAPVLEMLLECRGALDSPIHDIRFEGITFADATWLRPNQSGHADVQANLVMPLAGLGERDGCIYPVHNEDVKSPANVCLHGAHRIHFERCTFTRLGGAGLDIEYGSQDNVVSGCHFYDISGSGIQIGDVLRDDHHPADERLVVRGNRVENAYIHDIGVEYEDSVGIFAGYTQGTAIVHNELCGLPYSGVSMGWGWGEEDAGSGGYAVPYKYLSPTPARDNRIAFNHIHHVMMRRNDGGGVYTLGNQPGTAIEANHIHDSGPGGGPGGIYLDEGSGFIEITRNAVYNVPTPMNYNNRVQNRIETCNEHDNFFGISPDAAEFPSELAAEAGIQAPYRDLLGKR